MVVKDSDMKQKVITTSDENN